MLYLKHKYYNCEQFLDHYNIFINLMTLNKYIAYVLNTQQITKWLVISNRR